MSELKRVYDISQQYMQLMQNIEENEGIIEEDEEVLLQINKDNFSTISEELLKSIKILEGDIALANKEIERINKIKSTKQNIIDRFENVLLDAIKIYGEKDPKKDIWRFEVGTFKLSTRQSKQVVIDEELIDNEWKTVTIQDRLTLEELTKICDLLGKSIKAKTDILKTPIKDFLEKNGTIEGASIETNYSLTIK